MMLPQPSPCWPHWKPCALQVSGVHIGGGGLSGEMHDDRAKRRESSTFSCGVSGLAAPHSAGKVPVPEPPVLTWKSLNSTRPHCCAAGTEIGVLKVNSTGVLAPR